MNRIGLMIIDLKERDFDLLKEASELPDEEWIYISPSNKNAQKLLKQLKEVCS